MESYTNINEYIHQPMISYLGNKRKLLYHIKKYVDLVNPKNCLDGFVGSGVVSRMLKTNSYNLYINDLEPYSIAIQKAYLTNITNVERDYLNKTIDLLNKRVDELGKKSIVLEPFISKYYCPSETNNIKKGERCFYSKENGNRIDNYIYLLKHSEINDKIKDILIGVLLVKCSINTNTSGVFKAFYKVNDLGHWGGRNEHDLQRILKPIVLESPIFFNNNCNVHFSNNDITTFLKLNKDKMFDFVYYDPPYNQHPYGSNYFMLNTIYNSILKIDYIKNYKIDKNSVSGIPKDWNRSDFNYKKTCVVSFVNMIENTNSKYILLSYNNNGFITKDELISILKKKGDVTLEEIKYKNLNSRPNNNSGDKVNEYLFFVKCY